MIIKTKYEIGETVFVTHDIEQRARMITGIRITPGSHIYQTSQGINVTEFYEFELTKEKDILKTITS